MDGIKGKFVRIIPNEDILKYYYKDDSFEFLHALSIEESRGDLPAIIFQQLTKEQKEILSIEFSQSINYKVNKAIFLKKRFELTASADDAFYDIFCEKLAWNHHILEDERNLYILKKIPLKYLCCADELVLELRKENKISNLRNFFRNRIKDKFQNDLLKLDEDPASENDKSETRQMIINEFSSELKDSFRQSEDELSNIKKKYGSEAIINLAIGSSSIFLSILLNFGLHIPAFIPAIIGGIPAYESCKSIIEAFKNYKAQTKEIKRNPFFLLGSNLEKRKVAKKWITIQKYIFPKSINTLIW